MLGRFRQYAMLMRLHRPIGILLVLWPTLWALWIAAGGRPDPLVLVVFVLGVVLMRSAGCVINDYADRRFDPYVLRTRSRPIAVGQVSPREALVLFAMLSLTSFALVLLMNWLTIALSAVAVVLAATYPFMKRYTYLPQVHLGVAFGWAIPMAFAAQTGGVPRVAWLLFIAKVLWALAYDTMYAMVDRDDDIKIGVKSTAILFGDADRIIILGVQATVIGVLLLVGDQAGLGRYFHAGVAIAALLVVYQLSLVWTRDRDACFVAFLNNNWLGATVFGGIALDYSLRA